MSVVIAVAGPEGIALATDSRAIQLRESAGEHYRVTSDSAEKLFLLDRRFGIATYGVAVIGARTIRGHLEEFEVPTGEVNDCAEALGEFFWERLREITPAPRKDLPKTISPSWPLGFVIAGYDGEQVGTVVDVKVRPTGSKNEAAGLTTSRPGVVVRGQGDAVRRLIDGVDWAGMEHQGIELGADSREQLEELRYDLIDPATIEDAAGRARFLVETQIAMQGFSDGTLARPRTIPGCGGAVRVLTVARAGAAWFQNPGRELISPKRDVAVLGRAGEVG